MFQHSRKSLEMKTRWVSEGASNLNPCMLPLTCTTSAWNCTIGLESPGWNSTPTVFPISRLPSTCAAKPLSLRLKQCPIITPDPADSVVSTRMG